MPELRRWCVAWDAGPFGVSVDSRHLTPIDAYVWKLIGSCGYPGYYVTTIKKARAESRARQEAADRWLQLARTELRLRMARTERRPLVE